MSKSARILAEKHGVIDAVLNFAQAFDRYTKIRDIAISLTAPGDQQGVERTPINPPKLQSLPGRLVEEHCRIALDGVEIAAKERNRARSLNQYLAEREHVLAG